MSARFRTLALFFMEACDLIDATESFQEWQYRRSRTLYVGVVGVGGLACSFHAATLCAKGGNAGEIEKRLLLACTCLIMIGVRSAPLPPRYTRIALSAMFVASCFDKNLMCYRWTVKKSTTSWSTNTSVFRRFVVVSLACIVTCFTL